jgi:hypothetical protein
LFWRALEVALGAGGMFYQKMLEWVGIRDRSFSERLQMGAHLTLDKAKKLVRQREAVNEQETQLKATHQPLGLEELKTHRGSRSFTAWAKSWRETISKATSTTISMGPQNQ